MDFYISYAEADTAWAEWIAWQLEDVGHSTVVQAWDFSPGQNLVRRVHQEFARNTRVIMVLSAAYLTSALAEAEWTSAFLSDHDGEGSVDDRLIPVRIGDIRPSGLLSRLVSVDLYGVSETEARRRLLGSVGSKRSKPSLPPSFPGSVTEPEVGPRFPMATFEKSPSSQARLLINFHDTVQPLRDAGIVAKAHQWLIADQLDSGGWGRSQQALMDSLGHGPLTEIEFREGGIFSSYTAVMALREYIGDEIQFLASPAITRASRYFLQRQGHDGGFGRFVSSRSGLDIMRNLRHTAFAVIALIHLEGSPKAIARGVSYLAERVEDATWLDEASASTAPAAIINLAHHGVMSLEKPTVRNLESEILDGATRSEHAPLWAPYGKYPQMVFDTALSTIGLLPKPTPERLRSCVVRALSYIADFEMDGGIPYFPAAPKADIGMSSLMLVSIRDRIILDENIPAQVAERFHALTERITSYIGAYWEDPEQWAYTYTSTLQSLIRIA